MTTQNQKIDFELLKSAAGQSARRAATANETGGVDRRFAAFKDKNLSLDMTRGKPCAEQLDLSNDMMTVLGPGSYRAQDGTDTRNYGGLDGLPEAKALFAEFLEVAPTEVLIGDNSSLTLMHDAFARACSHGVPGYNPWSREPVRFLCPSPGYDRHFTICEHFGVEMIAVEMTDQGPDMNRVEELVASDPSIKGMWIVPKYSNPTGVTCSPEVVSRIGRMRTRADDFRVFWDNAYAHHHLTDSPPRLENLLEACKRANHADRVLLFGSTSKVSYAGAGLGFMGGSERNIAWMREHRSKSTIGPDKLNQLRHVRFFRDMAGIHAHMRRHAEILKPKFDAVERVLAHELRALGVARWTRPEGGYFVSFDTLDGCARAVVAMAAEVGVKLTQAGATYPYGKDPRDRNIRIAPSFPSLSDVDLAMEVLAVCVQRVTLARSNG